MIFTSYFAKTKQLIELGIYPIGISQIPPKFFFNPNIQAVAPSRSILFEYKNDPDIERYVRRYTDEILSQITTPQALIDYLYKLSGGKDVALCCYERSGVFCHRHLLADFLNKALGLNIQEYVFQSTSNGQTS